ncbi:MFS transporter [Streptomyces nogalater]
MGPGGPGLRLVPRHPRPLHRLRGPAQHRRGPGAGREQAPVDRQRLRHLLRRVPPGGGRTGDRFGARRVFLGATALFGASSLAAALTQDFTTLVVARALQGIGAGLLDPATLGLIQQVFPPGPKRNRAMAVWGAVGAIGLVGGVALGGLLTTVSWQWVFLVNVPIAAAVIVAGLFLLPGRRADAAAPTPLNALSGVLGTGAILLLVLGLTRLGDAGWSDPATLVGLAASWCWPPCGWCASGPAPAPDRP